MGQRIVDDNGVINFIDDNGVQCSVDDLGNFTCDPPPPYTAASRGQLWRSVIRILLGCLGLCSFLVIVLTK